MRQDDNPNVHNSNDNEGHKEPENLVEPNKTEDIDQEEVDESQESESKRKLTQTTRPIERLKPSMSGKSYVQQKNKNVSFKSHVDMQLKY